MSWKNWPYWLRGGVIGIAVGILCLFLANYCETRANLGGSASDLGDFRCFIFWGPAVVLPFFLLSILPGVENLISDGLIVIMGWFIVGVIVGILANRKLNTTGR